MSETDTPAEGETPDAPKDDADKPAPESTDQPKTFDADYVKRLRNEAAESRKARQKAEARVEEFENANKSELEKLASKATKAEQKAADAESKLTRYQVAAEKKVPAEAVDFLKGSTREELEASADQLLSLVKSRTDDKNAPDFDGGPREPAADPQTPEAAHNDTVLKLLGIQT